MKKNTHILIVDDDADDRDLFVEAVRDFDKNIRCVEVNNGEQALELLQSENGLIPDYIFLDLRMPRLSGKKCLELIKNDDRLKNIPVYIYTTSREVEESKELKKMGAVRFISKPNDDDDIYYLVAIALEEQIYLLPRDNNAETG